MTTQPNPAGSDEGRHGSPYQHLRRSPRFKAIDDREIAVSIRRAAGGVPQEIPGKVLDLSQGGAKLAVSSEVPLQETIEVRFVVPEVETQHVVTATVCWARTSGGSGWRLGCAFAAELPEPLLSALAVHGYIDRRECGREASGIATTVQWELTRDASPVQLQDVSLGGFSMSCPQSVSAGTRFRLAMTGPNGEAMIIPAVVRWQRKATDGYTLGCSFLEASGYQQLEQAVPTTGGAAREEGSATAADPSALAIAEVAPRPTANRGSESRLSVKTASRRAKILLGAAGTALVASFLLLQPGWISGEPNWLAAGAMMFGAALATAKYHRLTIYVIAEAADAARNGRLH